MTLVSAGSASAAGEQTTYTATESVPVPPASNFAGSGGGDGWSVALSNTQVFNVFHHSSTLQVVCHNQSDASVCFGPDTITDASGDNFATSGHPGLYLDQNSGKLWVYATRTSSDPTKNNTGGVVCIDTAQPASNPDPFCGFVALTAAGEAPTNGSWGLLSNPVQFGNQLYAFNYVNGVAAPVGGENAMLCFDVTTDAPCSGQPFTVSAGGGNAAVGSPSPAISLIGSQVVVPISINGSSELACMDASSHGNCGGSWPASLTGTNYTPGSEGPPFPLLDATGNTTGLCLPDTTDECFGLNGSTTATPSGMPSAIGSGSVSWNGPGLTLGPRVYVPAWSNIVYCYDASTNKACADPTTGTINFPKTFNNLDLLYTVNPDPQRPTCIWVNSDNGSAQIQNFDAYTGGACGTGPVRVLASQFIASGAQCVPTSYNFLQITSPANPGGTVQVADGDGNPIPGIQPLPIGANGMVNLTGLKLNTATGLPQFLITFSGQQSATQVDLKLSWNAPYDAACVADPDGDTSATNPAITATGSSITATEGTSFSGTVATFTDPDITAKSTDYSATIHWGDGTTSSGTISGSPSKFTVTASHTYAEEGSLSATVTIIDKDGSGNNATVTDKATVGDAALHATGATPSLSGTTASGAVATFTDGNPGGTASDFTASINWGDGTTTTGTVSKASNGQFSVSGNHTYAASGSYTIKVAIKDVGGSTASASVTIAAHVKAAKVRRGSAHLASVPVACVRGAFTMQIRGAQIASVSVRLDGRSTHATVMRRGKLYTARIFATPGAHMLTVRVTFKTASRTRARTFHRAVDGCAAPRFTG